MRDSLEYFSSKSNHLEIPDPSTLRRRRENTQRKEGRREKRRRETEQDTSALVAELEVTVDPNTPISSYFS